MSLRDRDWADTHEEEPMTTAEVLEDRNYVDENRMLERSARLADELHIIEHELTDLRERVHEVVCRSGRLPIEQKGGEIVDRLRGFIAGLDLTEIATLVRDVSQLKVEIAQRERDIAAMHHARCDARDAFEHAGSSV